MKILRGWEIGGNSGLYSDDTGKKIKNSLLELKRLNENGAEVDVVF